MDTSAIKYLINLPPDKRLMAGMMVIIAFLVGERAVTEYNYSNYRNKKENQIINMERDNSSQTIKYYNHLIDEENLRKDRLDQQTERLNRIDSIISRIEKKQGK